MVATSSALQRVREHVVQTGSSFLRNVRWPPPDPTCKICAGIPGSGYSTCYACSQRPVTVTRPLGLVTYTWPKGQAGQTMRAYKANGDTAHDLMTSLVAYATVAHWPCIETHTGSTPDGWACVPSLSGRSGPHPLEEIVSKFMRSVPNVAITPGPVRGNARSFDPNHFAVQTTSARHVLLIDDTWTTGAHLQSAAAALQKVGVEKVTGLVMARWLEPTFGNTQAFIEGLTSDFNPDICPYTGHFC